MRAVIDGRSGILALVVAAALLTVVAWVALASGPVETGQDRISGFTCRRGHP